MSLQSESTLAELRRADLRRRDEMRAYPDRRGTVDIEDDEAAETVTRTAVPITAAVLTMIAAAAIGIAVWSGVGAG